ncbi:MAG: hypothetical protein NTV72_03500 [Candidatus Taylorbacteria bacterium]|nr:hypothetical protein [Candidatus Taylorbacteria bacterium]
MIYLQEVESQGIALQESWAKDVPTLVWNKEFFVYPNINYKVSDENISAPYLTEQNGMFFKNAEEFDNKLPIFIKKLKYFTPGQFCRENLSIEKSTEIYANIIKNIQLPWIKTKKNS